MKPTRTDPRTDPGRARPVGSPPGSIRPESIRPESIRPDGIRPDWRLPLLVALIVVAWVCLLGPWWHVYELDPDEGINLMKGALVGAGHPLYTDVWSDQPPFLTYLLAVVVEIFGHSVPAARVLVLAFAGLLAASLFRIVRRTAGTEAAVLAVAVLASGGLFARLSVSVMIGLPAIALAVAALDLALGTAAAPRRTAILRTVLSAVVMALSLQTKLFTATMLPALLIALSSCPAPSSADGGRARRTALWLAVLGGVFAAFFWRGGAEMLGQLVMPHEAARSAAAFRYEGGPNYFAMMAWRHPQYMLLAMAGLLVARRRPGRALWIPLAWLAVAVPALLWQHPLWPHQLLLLAVPLAWLGGLCAVPLSAAWKGLRRQARISGTGAVRSLLATAAIAGAGFLAVPQIELTVHDFHAPVAADDAEAAQAMAHYKATTRWVVTDRPIDAFRAGLLSVPPLAVLTLKRLQTGFLPPERIVHYLRTYRPKQVAIRRLSLGQPVLDYLRKNYAVVIRDMRLYVRPPLAVAGNAPK